MINKNDRVILFILFIFCLAVRTSFIAQKNLWFDEIYSWHITLSSFKDIVIVTYGDIHPPLYYFTLKIWNNLFTDSVFSMRMMSVLFSSISLFFVYYISRAVLSRKESLLILILYIVSPLNIFYSQEVRMAAMNLFLNTFSTYIFIRLLNSNWKGESNPKYYFPRYVFFSILGLYTHYFTIHIIISQIVYLAFSYKSLSRRFLKQFAAVYLIIFLAYIPWLPAMFGQIAGGQTWRQNQNFIQVLNQLLLFTKDVSAGFYHRYAIITFNQILDIIVLIMILIFLYGIINKKFVLKNKNTSHFEKTGRFVILIYLLAVIPIIIALIISFFQWIEFFRYLSILIPYILILGFIACRNFNRKVKIGVLLFFFCLNMVGDYLYFKNDFKNNDYREIINTIKNNIKLEDEIYVYPYYYGWIIDYYQKEDNLSIPKAKDYGWDFNVLLNNISIQKPKEFWFVLDYSSVDTTGYNEKIRKLNSIYKISYQKSFSMIPNQVKLFKFAL